MSAQPEALRHANKLDAHEFDEPHAAAAELRRLNEEVETNGTIIQYHEASIARLTAQRDALLEVVQKYIAWSEAENDHKGTTFWERVEMCREVDELARAAIKAVEGE